jgi:DNA-binding CsgD family transcriptional regulator
VLARFRNATPAPALDPAKPEDDMPQLSQREKEVLVYITKGFTAREIAGLMQLSHFTVKTFVRRIYIKLNVNSKAEAIFEARNQGLLAGKQASGAGMNDPVIFSNRLSWRHTRPPASRHGRGAAGGVAGLAA